MKSPALFIALLLAASCTPKPPERVAGPEEVERRMIGLQKNFSQYDADGDDLLSHEELKNAMIRVGVKDVTDEKVRKVIEFYDFNKDGKISLREAQSGAVTGPDALIEQVR